MRRCVTPLSLRWLQMKRTPRSCAASSRGLGVECASRYLLSITEPRHLVTRTRTRRHERMREREQQAAAIFASLILSFGASHCCLKQLLTVPGFLSLQPASMKKQHMDARATCRRLPARHTLAQPVGSICYYKTIWDNQSNQQIIIISSDS